MKRLTMLMIILLALMVCSAVMADDLSDRWGIGITGGLMKPVGGNHDYASVDPFVGMWLRDGLSEHWSLEIGGKIGRWHQGVASPGDDAGITFSNEGVDHTNMWQAMGGVRYNLNPDNKYNPYLGVHLGAVGWRAVDEDLSNDLGFSNRENTVVGYSETGEVRQLESEKITASLTLGTEYFVGDNTSMDLGLRYHWFIDSDLDNIGTSAVWGPQEADVNDRMVEFFAGLTYYWGGNKDKDKDGILDADDNCPKEPEDMDGYMDNDGCPDFDNDNDGILDAQDACPDEAEDMDGFQDSDGCPDLDNDNDGVPDVRDNCPNDPEDIDGYMDGDGCPDVDNDGDGILDTADQCPDTEAGVVVDAKGCAMVKRRDLILRGVNFKFNSGELTPESTSILNDVSESLTIFDTITVEIAGYTDSSGSADYNKRLSQMRAETVLNYLASKGVAMNRMHAVGYGEDNPIASNNTVEGRQKNRRVELHRTD